MPGSPFVRCAAILCATFMLLSAAQGGSAAELTAGQTPRTDGSTIEWHLSLPDGATTLLAFAQGSGCLSVVHSESLRAVQAAFPQYAVLAVEKYGVRGGDRPADDVLGCSSDFYAHHTVAQRVDDLAQVIGDLRVEVPEIETLVLLGGSEGGLVAAVLASRVDADLAILLSTGGGLPFGEAVLSSIPAEGWSTVSAAMDKIRASARSTELWAGSSYIFWADILDRRVADDMLLAETQFLLVQGGNDKSSPGAAARAVSDLFTGAGRCTLTYWEYPGLDHAFADPDGQAYLVAVLGDVEAWAVRRLAADPSVPCANPE